MAQSVEEHKGRWSAALCQVHNTMAMTRLRTQMRLTQSKHLRCSLECDGIQAVRKEMGLILFSVSRGSEGVTTVLVDIRVWLGEGGAQLAIDTKNIAFYIRTWFFACCIFLGLFGMYSTLLDRWWSMREYLLSLF